MTKFKISGVGIDAARLQDLGNMKELDHGIQFVKTEIGANNEYLISDFQEGNYILIVSSGFIDGLEKALSGHLKSAHKDKADLLLLPAFKNWAETDYDLKASVGDLITSGLVDNIGLEEPRSVADIENFTKETGIEVKYIAITIYPYHFPKTILDYCEEHEIKVFGQNPFGGHINSRSVIASFTLPYLLGFTATWSDVVLLSAANWIEAVEDSDYLRTLMGQESDKSLYQVGKDIYRDFKEPVTAIALSLIVSPDLTLRLQEPDSIFALDEIKMGLKKVETKIGPYGWNDPPTVEEIKEAIGLVAKPSDGDDSDYMALVRAVIMENSAVQAYPYKSWTKIDKNMFFFSVTRENEIKTPWWKRRKVELVTETFFLAIRDEKVIFTSWDVIQNEKNSSSEVQSPNK